MHTHIIYCTGPKEESAESWLGSPSRCHITEPSIWCRALPAQPCVYLKDSQISNSSQGLKEITMQQSHPSGVMCMKKVFIFLCQIRRTHSVWLITAKGNSGARSSEYSKGGGRGMTNTTQTKHISHIWWQHILVKCLEGIHFEFLRTINYQNDQINVINLIWAVNLFDLKGVQLFTYCLCWHHLNPYRPSLGLLGHCGRCCKSIRGAVSWR